MKEGMELEMLFFLLAGCFRAFVWVNAASNFGVACVSFRLWIRKRKFFFNVMSESCLVDLCIKCQTFLFFPSDVNRYYFLYLTYIISYKMKQLNVIMKVVFHKHLIR